MGRAKSSGNGEKEEEEKAHGGVVNLVESLTGRWRMIAAVRLGNCFKKGIFDFRILDLRLMGFLFFLSASNTRSMLR